MLNHIVLQGRMCADSEIRMTGTGKQCASVNLAVDRDFSKDGQKETDFIPVVAWGNTAKFLAEHFAKGSMVIVSGRLQIRSWTDKDGNKRKTAEVIADNIYFGESKKETTQSAGSYAAPTANNFAVIEDEDQQLPF